MDNTMLILRRNLIELKNSDRDRLLTNLNLDTEKNTYGAGLDRFFKGESMKPWIGKIKKDKLEFCLKRTNTGLLRSQPSTILIQGEETNSSTFVTIDIHYGLQWYLVFSFFLVSIFILTVTYLNSNDIWGWLIGFFVWAIQPLFYIVDLNNSDNRFKEYIDSVLK